MPAPARKPDAKPAEVPAGMATPRQVAEYLHRPVKTLANWRSEGKGPRKYKRVGRGILYDWAGVYEWVEAQPSRLPRNAADPAA